MFPKIMLIGRRSILTKLQTIQSSAKRFRRCMDQAALVRKSNKLFKRTNKGGPLSSGPLLCSLTYHPLTFAPLLLLLQSTYDETRVSVHSDSCLCIAYLLA